MKIIKWFGKTKKPTLFKPLLKVHHTIMPDQQLSFNKWMTYIGKQVSYNFKKNKKHNPENGSGIGRYIFNGKELTDSELDELFPIHFKPASANKNPDGAGRLYSTHTL